jgi:hypothetical protein
MPHRHGVIGKILGPFGSHPANGSNTALETNVTISSGTQLPNSGLTQEVQSTSKVSLENQEPLTLDAVLSSPALARHFQNYLVRTLAEENGVFLSQLLEMRAAHTAEHRAGHAWDARAAHVDASSLVRMFFSRTSPLELNVPGCMRRRVLRAFRIRATALGSREGIDDHDTISIASESPSNVPEYPLTDEELEQKAVINLELCIGSPSSYFGMFDEVERHVTDLLAPRVRGFAVELSKNGEYVSQSYLIY